MINKFEKGIVQYKRTNWEFFEMYFHESGLRESTAIGIVLLVLDMLGIEKGGE